MIFHAPHTKVMFNTGNHNGLFNTLIAFLSYFYSATQKHFLLHTYFHSLRAGGKVYCCSRLLLHL